MSNWEDTVQAMPDADVWLAGAFAEVEFTDLDNPVVVRRVTSEEFAAKIVGSLDPLHLEALAAVLIQVRFKQAIEHIKSLQSR